MVVTVVDVCPACYKFFESMYDKKKMKEFRKIPEGEGAGSGRQCNSMYHKKLTDAFKS